MIDLKQSQVDIIDRLHKNEDPICIHASVRSGKTLATLLYISQVGYKNILWLAENKNEQNYELFEEMRKWKLESIISYITIILPSSLHKVDVMDFDLIVYNECHTITQKRWEHLSSANCKIIGLTGTYPDKLSKKKYLEWLGLVPKYEYLTDDAVGDKSIADYKINIFKVPLSNEKNIRVKTDKYDFLTSELKSYESLIGKLEILDNNNVVNISKKALIQQKINEFKPYAEENSDNKTILRNYYTENKHLSEKLQPYYNRKKQLRLQLSIMLNRFRSKADIAKDILELYKDERYLVFAHNTEEAEYITDYTYNSKTDKRYYSKFEKEEINHLCLVNKGGTGTTYHNLNGCIVLSINSSNVDMIQKIGRTLLFRKGYTANIIFLISEDTEQEEWLLKALSGLDSSKIHIENISNIDDIIELDNN